MRNLGNLLSAPSKRWIVATLSLLVAVLAVMAIIPSAAAQIASPLGKAADRYGDPEARKFLVGVEISADRGACRDVLAMIAVPYTCPEQQVTIIDEDISPQLKVEYRDLSEGVRQMLVRAAYLANGAQAHARLSFEVRTRPVLPPQSTEDLRIPRKPKASLKRYLGASPFIEARHRKIRSAARKALEGLPRDAPDWKRVESLYDYVRREVSYLEGPDKSAVATLQEGQGDCYAISAVFVALCRASKVPARMVWVENHCYPEFYLEDGDGEGTWFPCESAGQRAFGEMPLARIVFQKGDNFRIPERPKDRLRYASDWARGVPARSGGKPRVKFIREKL